MVSDPAPLDKSCPTTANDLLKVLGVLRTLTPQRRNELGLDWPESLPNRERFEDLVVTERDVRTKKTIPPAMRTTIYFNGYLLWGRMISVRLKAASQSYRIDWKEFRHGLMIG